MSFILTAQFINQPDVQLFTLAEWLCAIIMDWIVEIRGTYLPLIYVIIDSKRCSENPSGKSQAPPSSILSRSLNFLQFSTYRTAAP